MVRKFGHSGAADRIEHEREFLPCYGSFQLLGKVVVDDDDLVATCGNDLLGGCLAAYEVERVDAG